MAYSTQVDLLNQVTETELIQLTDDAGSGAIDAVKVTRAIADADALIDSYAIGKYDLPLVITDRVRALSVNLAIYELEKRRRRIREDTRQAYEDAMAFLKDVAAGKASLAGQVGGVATQQGTSQDVKVPDDKGVFSDENLEDF